MTPRNRRVRVLQHVAVEGPERIASLLAARGIGVDITRIYQGESVPTDLGDAAGLVVMGGPMGVYEGDLYPHLVQEQRLLERALHAGAPVLGVCLGSQLLAATLGARVAPGPRKELGWFPVTRLPGAHGDALFGALPDSFTALHWHGDIFDLPEGAVALARSELTALQAFRFGRSAYGLLFHLEVTPPQVESWVRAFAEEIAVARADGAEILARAGDSARETSATGASVFGAWADLL